MPQLCSPATLSCRRASKAAQKESNEHDSNPSNNSQSPQRTLPHGRWRPAAVWVFGEYRGGECNGHCQSIGNCIHHDVCSTNSSRVQSRSGAAPLECRSRFRASECGYSLDLNQEVGTVKPRHFNQCHRWGRRGVSQLRRIDPVLPDRSADHPSLSGKPST
jgi:hypothetical protein